ncbi:hypothetical protein GOODEAATRI_015976 [Goodea atripinnis]|uniref:Ig-like domain-containing protein n=1 Tax=Goodea atripinnis TaxID=208336 RepID=A0ABV0NKQ5_9TELE
MLVCVLKVSGMRVYTSGDVEAVNGTDVRLRCTFESSAKINPNLVIISWTFRPLSGGREDRVFHYQQRPYPPTEGIFKKRISWAGDIMGSDASIIIREVKFTYNGTYTCQVTNPPDVHGPVGEIRLRVVKTGDARGNTDRDSWRAMKRFPAKRGKTPLRGKTNEMQLMKRGTKRGAEDSHAFSLSPCETLGIRACYAPFWGQGLFSCLMLLFLPYATAVFGCHIWFSNRQLL